jgi:hypothetical protein
MRIGTNPVGNYSPVYKRTDIQKATKAMATKEETAITKNEKAFFSKLYPQNSEQIMDHHFYMKDGNMSGVMVGSLFDRKG